MLELGLGSKRQLTDFRVQPVAPGDQVETILRAIAEPNAHACVVPFEPDDRAAKACFDAIARTVDRAGDVAPRDAEIPALEQLLVRPDLRGGDSPPTSADEAEFLHIVTQLAQLGHDAHPLGHRVARAPEVDDIPAGAQQR